jgi:hypothetical protein
MRKYLIPFFAGAILLVGLSACGPNPSYNFYVSLSGNDAAQCISADAPCLTLAGALDKARELSTSFTEAADGEPSDFTIVINVAAGTYLVEAAAVGEPFALLDFSANILGAGLNETIFEAGGAYGGILVDGDVRFLLRDFTIQNVTGGEIEGCIHIRGAAQGTIERVKVLQCLEAGIVNNATLGSDRPIDLRYVSVVLTAAVREYRGAISGEAGHGIVNAGAMDIRDSYIRLNEGVGVFSSRSLYMMDSVVELNAKSGLLLSGEAILENPSIRSNGQDGCEPDPWVGACGEGSSAGIEIVTNGRIQVNGGSITRNLYGAYVDSPGALLTLIGTTVGANNLPGLYVLEGELRVLESQISNNARYFLTGEPYGAAANADHAIYVGAEADANIIESRVDGNQNGGIYNRGGLLVTDSSISGNLGEERALLNSGTARLENTLIGSNQMVRGISEGASPWSAGAVVNLSDASMQLVNTTVSENLGYGIVNMGSMHLSYSTVAYNETVGIMLFFSVGLSEAATVVENSLIVGQPERDCSSQNISLLAPVNSGLNIDTDNSCHFGQSFTVADLMLEELADNGGFTMTNALVPGSPALDAALGDCPPTDQRLVVRPAGSACDVGAYEASEMTATLPLVAATATEEATGETGFYVIPNENYNCREGNSSLFEIADTLLKSEQYIPIGIGPDKLWLQFLGPTYNEKCWSPAEGFSLYLNGILTNIDEFPAELLPTVQYPLAPTPTPDPDESYEPTPTATCYYNQQQQYICP